MRHRARCPAAPPRRASAGKRYRYLVLASPTRDPLLRDRAWHLWGELDLGRLRREALHLPGTHDFAAFRAADCERETTRRHLFSVDVVAGYGGRDDLVAIGLTPGPRFRGILDAVYDLQLEGAVADRASALEAARQRAGPGSAGGR